MNKKQIGQNIQFLRKNYGMTQAELAEITGYSVDHISHVEAGFHSISLQFLLILCKTLDVTPNDVLTGEYEEELLESDATHLNSLRDRTLTLKNLNARDIMLLDYLYQYMEKRK